MTTISTQLRTFKEPTKDQLTQTFFSIPSLTWLYGEQPLPEDLEKMEISAVLSLVNGDEDSYVSGGVVCDARRIVQEIAYCNHLVLVKNRQGNCISYPRFSHLCLTTASPSASRSRCRPFDG